MEWPIEKAVEFIAIAVAISSFIAMRIWQLREAKPKLLGLMKINRKECIKAARLYGVKARWWWSEKRTRAKVKEAVKYNTRRNR